MGKRHVMHKAMEVRLHEGNQPGSIIPNVLQLRLLEMIIATIPRNRPFYQKLGKWLLRRITTIYGRVQSIDDAYLGIADLAFHRG
jgi:hypothetical protein